MRTNTKKLVADAMIAALYTVLTEALALLPACFPVLRRVLTFPFGTPVRFRLPSP